MNIMNDRARIKRILFITLSNLGDIILTTPVFVELLREFPSADIDVISGEPGGEIFSKHPSVRTISFHSNNKTLLRRMSLLKEIRGQHYDLVVDLKNSLIPYLSGARYRTSSMDLSKDKYFMKNNISSHKINEHLYKLVNLGMDPFKGHNFFVPFAIGDEDKSIQIFEEIDNASKTVIISPGAKSHLKRWPAGKFAELSDKLTKELECNVFFVGDDSDREIVDVIFHDTCEKAVDLCGKTSLGVLAVLMKKADLVVTNDSAPLHLASAVNVPTVAIFGPTDEMKYGPVSEKRKVLKPDKKCRPCEKALCAVGPDEGCIGEINVDEVYQAAKELLQIEKRTD